MQHHDAKREADVERRKRAREDHFRWRALMFPSRPPPPFVPVDPQERRNDGTPLPSSSCAAMVALIRAQESASSKDAAKKSSDGNTSVGPCHSTTPLDSSATEDARLGSSPCTLSPLEVRMQAEMARRNPLMDAKRTPNPSATMAVFRIPKEATEDDLRNFGARFGHVVCVRLVRNVAGGASRGYGFIQFSYAREMERAVRECADPAAAPRPKIRGRIVACEPERSRTNLDHVPARMVITAAKLKKAAQESQAASAAAAASTAAPSGDGIDEGATARSAADAFLDSIDDVLADWT